MDRRDLLKASLAGVCVLMSAQLAFGQPAATAPGAAGAALAAYDVVSVKPVQQNGKMMMMGVRIVPDGIDGEFVTVAMLVKIAFGGGLKLPTDDSITGLPDWARTDYFSVQAKMSGEQMAEFAKLDKDAQEDQREAMIQALLADRFKLKVHRDPKTVPDYELVVAKGGSKMKDTSGADPFAANPLGPPPPPPPPGGMKGPDGKPITGGYLMISSGGKLTAHGFTMTQLANFLGQPLSGLGRMVKDKTGLTGKYDFTTTFQMPQGVGPGPPGGPAPAAATAAEAAEPLPSIFTALQDDLGLKLQPGTGTINTVVVEHVEKPTAD